MRHDYFKLNLMNPYGLGSNPALSANCYPDLLWYLQHLSWTTAEQADPSTFPHRMHLQILLKIGFIFLRIQIYLQSQASLPIHQGPVPTMWRVWQTTSTTTIGSLLEKAGEAGKSRPTAKSAHNAVHLDLSVDPGSSAIHTVFWRSRTSGRSSL